MMSAVLLLLLMMMKMMPMMMNRPAVSSSGPAFFDCIRMQNWIGLNRSAQDDIISLMRVQEPLGFCGYIDVSACDVFSG